MGRGTGRASCIVVTFVLVAAAMGCSTNITSVQPARLTPAGHTSLTSSVGANAPVGVARDSLDAFTEIGDVSGRLNADDIELVALTANAIATHAPAADVQFGLAYGLSRRLEINARIDSTSFGLGARVQVLRVRPGIYGAIGLQLSGALSSLPPLGRFVSVFTVDEYRRIAVSVPLVFGYSSTRVHLWAGPKVVFAAHRIEATVCLREVDSCVEQATARGGGRAVYAAGQVGVALGKRRFWLALELTFARVAVDANLDIDVRGTTNSYAYSPRGFVFQPALGLITWF